MRFDWDERKSRSNHRKHGVSFDTARSVFDDPHALSKLERVVDGEERWQTIGMTDEIVLLVAHTWRDESGDEVIRLISARKATPTERQAYAENEKHQSQ